MSYIYYFNNVKYETCSIKEWTIDNDKKLHRDGDEPAWISSWLTEWWKHGKLHRDGDTGLGRIPAHVRELGLTCICPLVTYTSFNAGKKENITEILIYQNCSICN